MKLSIVRAVAVTALTATVVFSPISSAAAQSHVGSVPPPDDEGSASVYPTEGIPAPEIDPAAFVGLVVLLIGGTLVMGSRRVRARAPEAGR